MKTIVFERKIYSKLLDWKQHRAGETALLIEGARRVGKSTLVKEFAQREYASHILIDFNKTSPDIKNLFEDLNNLDYLFLYLQTAFHTTLKERKSLIIFDEVQNCPMARQAIKYLVEDGRYDYIETGSLISMKKHTANITIPSEEERMQMFPMDFEEFLWALNDHTTHTLLQKFWHDKHALGPAHRTVERTLRLYMLVGGMPQVVSEYIRTNNFEKVDSVKRNILKLYEEDFLKIDSSRKLSKMFSSIPAMLSRNAMRYVPYSVIGNAGEDKLAEMLMDMEDSKTVNFCHHCDNPSVGMGLTKNDTRFKLFLGDTGLFVTLAFLDKDFTENEIYTQLLNDKLSVNLGYVYENLVAQMLVAAGHQLYYYTWQKDEKHYYEVDFLISRGKKICPIEVKSSGYKTHASLDAFMNKFSARIHRSYLIYTKDYSHDGEVQYIPPYFIPFV